MIFKTLAISSSLIACATAASIPVRRGNGKGVGNNNNKAEVSTSTFAETSTSVTTTTVSESASVTELPSTTTDADDAGETGGADAPPPPANGGADGVTSAATKALVVSFVSPPAANGGNETFSADTLVQAVPLIDQEVGTLSWFGSQVTDEAGVVSDEFVIFDTFASDAERATHLQGDVASSVIAQAPTFTGGLKVDAVDILALKSADGTDGAAVTKGLHVAFEAQADKIADVQQLCVDAQALAEAEDGTINWLCGQVAGTTQFVVLDSFIDAAGRDAHLNGEIAKTLFAAVPDLLVADPEIKLLDIEAASVKGEAAGAAGGGAADDNKDVNANVGEQGAVPITSTATLGLFVPFSALENTAADVKAFVEGATGLAAAEPGTLQWFAAALENSTANTDLLIYDTFATEEDRQAHLGGQVAAGLFQNIASLSSVKVVPFDILAIKSTNDAAIVDSPTSGVTVGLQVLFNATTEADIPKVEELCAAGLDLVNQEEGTLHWICGKIPDTQTFLILDSFPDEASRQAHLDGEVAKALFALVGQGIDEPDVQLTEIFAATTKPEPDAAGGAADNGNNNEDQNGGVDNGAGAEQDTGAGAQEDNGAEQDNTGNENDNANQNGNGQGKAQQGNPEITNVNIQ